MMLHVEKKKSVKQKEKGPTKRFSFDLMGHKRLDQEIKKEISDLTSRWPSFFCARFRIHQLVFALRNKESGSGLCLKLYLLRKQGLLLRFTSKRSLRDKERLTHKWKICNFRILGFFANLTCLNVSVSDFLFFTKNHPTSANLFFVWFQSQSWFSFFCLVLWKLLSLGCKVIFCSVFRLTEN